MRLAQVSIQGLSLCVLALHLLATVICLLARCDDSSFTFFQWTGLPQMSAQEVLRSAWLHGTEDRLCGREQAKAWALREVWLEQGNSMYGCYSFVAERVRKTKDGKPVGDHPSKGAISEFFQKVDSDPEWFPGKHSDEQRGPKRLLRGPKLTAVVSAAKRLKAEGTEPTYSVVVAACPKATLNPATGQPVDKSLIYTVFREACYDDDPNDTWDHLSRLSKTALDDATMDKRYKFAVHMLAVPHTSTWYHNHLVWCDLCNSVLARTQKKASEMALARKGGKGWQSSRSRGKPENRAGPGHVLKLSGSDTVRVWWIPILTRGKLHIEALPEKFPGETGEGAEIMVSKVRAALNIRFQGTTAPGTLFTDRGNGFYDSNSGQITEKYKNALRAHRLKAFFPENALVQPGKSGDLMLHETAVAWMRYRLVKTQPKKCWEESVDAYVSRLKSCAAYINDNYDVDNLCRELLDRMEALKKAGGDRLNK